MNSFAPGTGADGGFLGRGHGFLGTASVAANAGDGSGSACRRPSPFVENVERAGPSFQQLRPGRGVRLIRVTWKSQRGPACSGWTCVLEYPVQ